MMSTRQKEEQDRYLLRLLGVRCQIGYHASSAMPASSSTLGRAVETAKIPESSRKAALEAR